MPAEGGIRFGQYVLQRRIARGGVAEVFLAQQRGLEGAGRRVAVKRILPQLASAPDFIQMFLGEAKLAAQLSHPNIVHIYDFGKVDTDYVIAMEYVDGVHAGQVFRRADTDRLSPALVARIGADAAAALHYAHALRAPDGQPYGLVHRDVSPPNLMVSFDGVVKLCDFGIAKAVALDDRRSRIAGGGAPDGSAGGAGVLPRGIDRQLTSPGLVKGKYGYMSPEQTVGAALDGRSDVYSLAVVLWELLAGQVRVPRGDAVRAMQAIRNGTLAPITQAAPWTPAPLAEAIAWALETRREQRATAAQFAHALEAFIKSSPEIATPMQLGSWLRARFPRESSGPVAAPGVVGAEPSSRFDLGSLTSPGSIDSAETSEAAAQGATGFEATDPPAALPIFPPAEPPPDTIALEHGETLMRSGAYRPVVPSGPAAAPTLLEPPPAAAPTLLEPPAAAAPTLLESRPVAVAALLESRPVAAQRMSPARGVPARPPQHAPRVPAMSPAARIAALALGMCGLAILSFAVVLAVRGSRRNSTGHAAALVPRDAPDARPDARPDAWPIDAPPSPAAAPDAPPADAGMPDAAATARLDVHTEPAGATVAIYRCDEAALESCGRGRSTGAAKVDGCSTAQCAFRLPAGTYEIVVDLDGASERRAVALTGDVATSLDIVVKAHGGRPAAGKLTVHTRQRCEAIVDARRHLQTPIVELELRPGPHRLELTCGHRALTRSVTIAPGKTTELTVAPR